MFCRIKNSENVIELIRIKSVSENLVDSVTAINGGNPQMQSTLTAYQNLKIISFCRMPCASEPFTYIYVILKVSYTLFLKNLEMNLS